MTDHTISRREELILNLGGYATLAALAILGLSVLQETPARLAALALCGIFGLLMALCPKRLDGRASSYWYVGAQTAVVWLLMVIEPPSLMFFGILYFILSAQAMMFFPQRVGLAWLAVFALITSLTMLVKTGGGKPLLLILPYIGGYYFFGAFASALKRADAARRETQRLLHDLQAAHQQLQQYAEQVEALAAAQERNRLAREMHDTLGHRLTVAAVQLEGAQRLIPSDPARAAQMVGTVREQVREALSELRHTVAALRAPLEVDLSLPNALRRLAAAFEEATAITVHLLLPQELPLLPDTHRQALYRAAQEGLTNIQRHARASQVWLQLTHADGRLSLLVADDGMGLPEDAERAGFGLRGLHERAGMLGGALYLDARPGGGAQLCLTLPLTMEVAHG